MTSSSVLPGRPAYITNGMDKQGLLCGTTQTVNGTFVDLRNYKYLYFTDPFRLFSSIEVDYAPSMCVTSCPGDADACQLSALPCTSNNQYRYANTQKTCNLALRCSMGARQACIPIAALHKHLPQAIGHRKPQLLCLLACTCLRMHELLDPFWKPSTDFCH